MFRKVLIANRGAIACRIIRTLDRMGIASVAVYSEADRHSMHVMQAGEAVAIGPSPAAESYLKIDAILDAARKTRRRSHSSGLRLSVGKSRLCRGVRDRPASCSSARSRSTCAPSA